MVGGILAGGEKDWGWNCGGEMVGGDSAGVKWHVTAFMALAVIIAVCRHIAPDNFAPRIFFLHFSPQQNRPRPISLPNQQKNQGNMQLNG